MSRGRWAALHTGLDRVSDHRVVEGVKLLVPGDQVIRASDRKWGGRGFEPESMQAWRAAVRRGSTAVDGGAYTGLFTIAAAQEGSLVQSFEPNPAAFERLRQNVALNGVEGPCELHEVALADEVGQGRMVQRNSPLTSAARMEWEKRGSVDVFPLDFALCECATVSAIKLDVEGGELAALAGARITVERCRPLLIVEVLSERAQGDVEDLVEDWGYSWRKADGRNLVCEPT